MFILAGFQSKRVDLLLEQYFRFVFKKDPELIEHLSEMAKGMGGKLIDEDTFVDVQLKSLQFKTEMRHDYLI